MPPNWEAYQEAYKRGILPDDKKALYEEALNRGLVPGMGPQQSKPSLLQRVGQNALNLPAKGLGILETGANIFSQAYGVPLSGLAGLAATPFGKGPEAVETVQNALISRPKTEAGQKLTETISYPFQKLSENVAQPAADWITGQLGPEAGTAAGTLIEASPLLLGFKGAKAKAFTPKEQMAIDLYKKGVPVGKGTFMEKLAEKVPPGNLFFRKQRKMINENIIEANKQFVTEELGLPDPKIKPTLPEMTQKAWNEFNNALAPDQKVRMPNVEKWINENLNALPNTKEMGPLKARLSKVIGEIIDTDGFVSWDKVTKINQNIWAGKKYKNLDPATRHTLGKLSEALGEDLQFMQQNTGTMAIPKVYDLFDKAMENTKLGHRVSLAVKIEAMFNEPNVLKFDIEKGVGIFNPAQFKQVVERKLSGIAANLPKDSPIPGMIQAWADKMMYIAESQGAYARQFSLGSEALKYASMGGPPGLMGKITAMSPITAGAIAVPWGFESWMAHSLAHPRGWLKKFVMRETRPFQGLPGKVGATGTVMGVPKQFEEEYGMPAQ